MQTEVKSAKFKFLDSSEIVARPTQEIACAFKRPRPHFCRFLALFGSILVGKIDPSVEQKIGIYIKILNQ